MLRIGQVETTATSDNKYTDGNVAGGVAATRLRAAAFNAIQEELAYLIETAGITLDVNNTTQVLAAIKTLTTGRLINIQYFTASGTYTPTEGTKKIRVRICGGGGAGGGAAASTTSGYLAAGHGGNGGSYGETRLIDASSITSVAVIVGSAGTGSAGANGTDGGASSFGSYITAPGGRGGNYGASGAATDSWVPDYSQSDECTGSAMSISIPGQGGFGQMSFVTGSAKGGRGGSSVLGTGGSAYVINTTGGYGWGFGGGGAGSVTTYTNGTSATAGGHGARGEVIVEEYA